MRLKIDLRWLISVPMVALPLAFLPAQHASAAGVAEEALRILARARASDERCSILTAGERSELSAYLARAEVAAASQSGAGAASAAIAAGTAQGKSGSCGKETTTDVRETLVAAREAVAAAGAARPASTPKRSKADDSRKAAKTSGGGLARYGRIVQAYYLERECRSLSRSEQRDFYKGIVRLHKDAVAANGAGHVEPLMRRAERRAASAGCGRSAREKIRQGYAELSGR